MSVSLVQNKDLTAMSHVLKKGLKYIPGCLDRSAQESLLEEIRAGTAKAPLFVPKMPRTGKPMSVRMTNFGPLGWVTDQKNGYRYQAQHPETGKPWPDIPSSLLALWEEHADFSGAPEACLVNYYDKDARMGLHVDNDEKDFSAPVLSVSLGNTCLFRFGGEKRTDKTSSIKLKSGDVVIMSQDARLIYHGVDRIYSGSSSLLKQDGRINLTLRRVNP